MANIKKNKGFNYKQQVYFEQNPKFTDNFGFRCLYILDQASRPKHTFEEKTKLKFNHFDIKFMLQNNIKNSEIEFRHSG